MPPAAHSSHSASAGSPRGITATIAVEYANDAEEPASGGAGRDPVERAPDTVSCSGTAGCFSCGEKYVHAHLWSPASTCPVIRYSSVRTSSGRGAPAGFESKSPMGGRAYSERRRGRLVLAQPARRGPRVKSEPKQQSCRTKRSPPCGGSTPL